MNNAATVAIEVAYALMITPDFISSGILETKGKSLLIYLLLSLMILRLPFAYDMIRILPDTESPVNRISTDYLIDPEYASRFMLCASRFMLTDGSISSVWHKGQSGLLVGRGHRRLLFLRLSFAILG